MKTSNGPTLRIHWINVASVILCISVLIPCIYVLARTSHCIVYVDSSKLVMGYKGTLAARTAYEKRAAVWTANIDSLSAELNALSAAYHSKKSTLSVSEKKLNEELISLKTQQLDNYKEAIRENAAREDKDVTAEVYREIDAFLKRYGEEHHYEFILAATTLSNVVYAERGKNVTDDVISAINATYPSQK